jgi:integral membrane sensor domain MASE1
LNLSGSARWFDRAGARIPALTLVAQAIALAAAYVLFARIGLKIHPVNNFATLVWAPTGVSLAALLLFGIRLWPGIAAGALIVNLWTGAPVPVAMAIAAGNTLESLFAVWVLTRIPGFRRSLDRVGDVVALLIVGGVFSTMISATIGTGSLWIGGVLPREGVWFSWRTWWLGDAIGDFVVAPLLLTWNVAPRGRVRFLRAVEAAVLAILHAAATAFVFELTRNGIAALLSPLLVWAAVRFGQRGAARGRVSRGVPPPARQGARVGASSRPPGSCAPSTTAALRSGRRPPPSRSPSSP